MEKINAFPKIPKNWLWTRLGEVCYDSQYGWTTSAAEKGNLHLLRTTDITSGNVNWGSVPYCKKNPLEVEKYLLKNGDIVISRAGSVGYSHLLKNPERAIFDSYLIRFRPLINEKFLGYFLKSPLYWKSISEEKLGIAIPNVNATKLKQINIPLPPLPEQHRIVNKIEELFTKLDAGVEALKKVKGQIKRYRQSVLKHAFEGKLTEEWRKENKSQLEPASVLLQKIKEDRKKKDKGKYKELSPIDKSELMELPEGWDWTQVSEISDVITGNTPSKSKLEYYGKEYPFFKPTDLNAGYYVRASTDGLSKKGVKKARFLKAKSILVTCIGATIGKTGFMRVEGAFNQQINAIMPYNHIIPEYIYYIAISPQFQKSIINNASSTTLPILNKSRFEVLNVPIPPIKEQERIVHEIERLFSIADEVEKNIEQSIKQAESLRQSVLKRAFEGKLVPQDPSDEPAEKLLDRIKLEKTKIRKRKENKKKY